MDLRPDRSKHSAGMEALISPLLGSFGAFLSRGLYGLVAHPWLAVGNFATASFSHAERKLAVCACADEDKCEIVRSYPQN
jgi:hypothetical protein